MRRDAGPVERFLWGFWILNVALFLCLVPPTILLGNAGWPLRLAAIAGLLGACVWEAVALRARRFPLWADVLETLAIVVLAWRYPAQTDPPVLVFVITFALAGLGYRVLYGPPWQAALRTVTMLAAIYAGRLISLPGHDPYVVFDRMLPLFVPAVFVAVMCGLLVRMPGVAARGRRAARQLNSDLIAAETRDEVHHALLGAVLDLLSDRSDVRVMIWDESSGLRPVAAAGYRANEALESAKRAVTLPRWLLDPILAGEPFYLELSDYDFSEELREAFGFPPISGATFTVPLHQNELRALSVGARHPIPVLARREIENLAKIAEMTLESMELTEQLRVSQDALHKRSNYDPLTRLPNRNLLLRNLEQALSGSDRLVGLIHLDLDQFQAINDSLGRLAADDGLVAVARRLTRAVRPGDTVARLGDDEFGVLLDRLDSPSEAEQVAQRILEVLSAPLTGVLGRHSDVFVRTNASVGLALSGPYARTPQELLSNAQVAMHAAETGGGSTLRAFEPAMRAAVLYRLELASDLSRALERDELVVHYQPIVDLTNGTVVGVEALARWRHPKRGMIPSATFIPIAEESGLISEIGDWVLRQGCEQLLSWSAARPELEGLFLNVNLSPRQLAQPGLARAVGRIIYDVGVDPRRVTLELTESTLVEDTEANLGKLQSLKTLGLRLAIDDFGTGFSSLSYLRRFPFDQIKVDRAFVQGVGAEGDDKEDQDAAALAAAIISMGHSLGLQCIAEGVETRKQMDWLRSHNCETAQGHLFAPAIPPDEVLPLLSGPMPAFASPM
jgi:diguanylate cyclase (GGDEF)-like protein